VSKTEELLGSKSSGSGLKDREDDRLDPLFWSAKVGTDFAVDGRSIGIVRLQTEATDFSFLDN
jgi:hypothetical protein